MTANIHSPYAPVRLREQDWWRFSCEVAKHGYVTTKGQIASELPNLILENFIAPAMMQAKKMDLQEGEEDGHLHIFAKLLTLRQWVPLIAQYELSGKQIFDLDDEVVNLLRMTDVEDCRLDQWNAPYDSFFLRFGKQSDVRIPFGDDFEYLDGAFVAVTPWGDTGSERRIKIGLTTVKEDGSGVQMPGYFCDLNPDELELPPSQAVDAFIARKCAELDAEQGLSDLNADIRDIRKEEYQQGASLLKEAVALIVNSLFYIESIGSSSTKAPGRDVPPETTSAWRQAPESRKFKASQKVTRDGYVMVHMLGDHGHSGARLVETRQGVATHWRRGHWRLQPHGPQMSLRKRVWIRPVMVNQDAHHDDLSGHIYAIPSTSKQREKL